MIPLRWWSAGLYATPSYLLTIPFFRNSIDLAPLAISNLTYPRPKLSISPSTTMSTLKSNFSFQWQTKGVSYLGVIMPSNLSNLFPLNYVPLLSRIQKDLEEWGGSSLLWFGRINALKMDTLPKLLYLLQTIPILVPKSFFTSLRSLVIRFMWNRGLPRVKYNLLTHSKIQGGVDLPDYETYYKAAHVARILDWFPRPFLKASVTIEQDLAPVDLRALLWGYKTNITRIPPP